VFFFDRNREMGHYFFFAISGKNHQSGAGTTIKVVLACHEYFCVAFLFFGRYFLGFSLFFFIVKMF